ncbi:ABC transporter substrate-binding protein [Acuticoccus sp. I52.16.1]|uniref:ABC transporter substrate-binding protein n=1 Tax=Acuticoccus sp. I52.16.1 TaxID=2928472 RepID=UPI001FCF89FD|nr:ABC transporter substrate-binding protein [Acuticoccus sp. I52.16.1]UOM33948.1 ABC transporter substrate-binding protein [Acuticoccus sp. I52.16.1]
MRITRRNLLKTSAAAGLVGAAGFPAGLSAQEQTKLSMILNWRYQGPQAWFFLAQDKGYFEEYGLEIQMDQGNGSGAAVGAVASGSYDTGFGDVNALIQLAAEKPEEAPICVYQMYNTPPFTVAVLASSEIESAKDLEGKHLGGAANDGALKLWPAFTQVAGLDTSGVEITNFAPNLREQMLKSGQVDGVFGYVNTIRFSAKLSGMNPDEEIRFISFGDYGMDLYSNGIIVPKKLTEENPEAVRGLVRAINKGIADTLADLDAGIAAVVDREPLINAAIEKERLVATLADEMNHPEVAEFGLGNIDPERFQKAIDIVVEARGLPRTPDISEIFTPDFLPPEDERIYKLV